ncbi:RING/U-box superfamily protein [Euphorbia peplus]|nr:RING/U-box superfamily protein [Euphorbia peplus]
MATDDREICCHVTPMAVTETEEDDSGSCNMFKLDVCASFMPRINESDFEEDESELYNLGCDIVEKTFTIECEKLCSEETSTETIRGILVSMNIPDESFLIDRILNCACPMASSQQNMSHRVLYLRVEIDLPPGFETTDGMYVDDDDELESRLVPASKKSIEALEKVRVEDSINCTICLEEVLAGSEATRVPCLHVFHSPCIVNWLQKCRACPLCRNEIN